MIPFCPTHPPTILIPHPHPDIKPRHISKLQADPITHTLTRTIFGTLAAIDNTTTQTLYFANNTHHTRHPTT